MGVRLPGTGTQAGRSTFNPGKVVESNQGDISSAAGGSISLPGGAHLDVPAGAIDTDTEVTLVRADGEGGNVPNRGDLYSGLYYATSNQKPIVNGVVSLAIPYDYDKLPSGLAEEDLAAYFVIGDALVPVEGQVDTSRHVIVIPNPHITAADPPVEPTPVLPESSQDVRQTAGANTLGINLRMNLMSPARSPLRQLGKPGNIAYGVFNPTQLATRYDPSLTCRTGRKGEAHIEPGSPFYIYLGVDTTCDFVKFVDARLQEGYNAYKRDYADNAGKGPLDYFTPDQHMGVYFQPLDSGIDAEYEYRDWQGYISVDYDKIKGNTNPARLESMRKNLYHELFHAVQDRYRNMWAAGIGSRWWIEATAEHAALRVRGLTFQEQVLEETTNVSKYMLAIPPRASSPRADGSPAYAYSLLISYVEQQKPGYLRDALNNIGITEFTYDHMVESGKLDQTYPDFVQQVLLAASTVPGRGLWSEGVVSESDQQTRVQEWSEGSVGGALSDPQIITDETARAQPHHFQSKLGPLTTHVYVVQQQTLTKPRKVKVDLLLGGNPSNNAWLLKVDDAGKAVGGPVRLDSTGTTVNGLGRDFRTLYIAVFNTELDRSAARTKVYSGLPSDLAITLESQDTVDLCSYLPPDQEWQMSPFNTRGFCQANSRDGLISVITINDYGTLDAAHAKVDSSGKTRGTVTDKFGDAGYAVLISPEDSGRMGTPGYELVHVAMFSRGRYVVEVYGGYDRSIDPSGPYPPDRVYAVAKYVDDQLKNAP
jgi:hypothetical protein